MVMIDSKFDLGQVIIIRQFQLSAAHFWKDSSSNRYCHQVIIIHQFQLSAAHFWKDSSSNRYCHPFLRPFPSMVWVLLLILAYHPSWKRKDSLRAPSHDHRPDASRPDCFILGANKVLDSTAVPFLGNHLYNNLERKTMATDPCSTWSPSQIVWQKHPKSPLFQYTLED